MGGATTGGTGPDVGGTIDATGGKAPVAGGGGTGNSSTTAGEPRDGPMDALRKLTACNTSSPSIDDPMR